MVRQDKTAAPAALPTPSVFPAPTVTTGDLQPVGSPSGGPWVLAWSDEFDTPVNGQPDPAVWATHFIEGDATRCNDNATETEWYSHNGAGVPVAGGVLTLTSRHEDPRNAGSVGYDPLCPATLPNGNTATHTSGMIQSKPGFAFTGGYVEARLQVPAGQWPAFWMVAADGAWPPEFDIEEYSTGHGPSATVWGNSGFINSYTKSSDGGWHTWGMKRVPGVSAQFFYDGASFGTCSDSSVASRAMAVILNLAVEGGTSAYSMAIDYVRAWVVSGVPAQPVVSSLNPATGIPSSGSVQVSFGAVSGATGYRVTSCPVDGIADGGANTGISATGQARSRYRG